MDFRLRKCFRILPAFWFNSSKTGETPVGEIGTIPGTGITYMETSTIFSKAPARRKIPTWVWSLLAAIVTLVVMAALPGTT